MFSIREGRLKEFLTVAIEIQGKPEIEIEITTAITNAPQVKDEPFITVERYANTRRRKQMLISIAQDSCVAAKCSRDF